MYHVYVLVEICGKLILSHILLGLPVHKTVVNIIGKIQQ